MNTSDTALLYRWRQHSDPDAFRLLVNRYAPMVYATCRRALNNDADAEEVAQDCFEILAAHAQPRKLKHIGAWLHGVATKRAINRIRTDTRRTRQARARRQTAARKPPHTEDIQTTNERPRDVRERGLCLTCGRRRAYCGWLMGNRPLGCA